MRLILCLIWAFFVGFVFCELMDFKYLDKNYIFNEEVKPKEEKFEISKEMPTTEEDNSRSEKIIERSPIAPSTISYEDNIHIFKEIDVFKDYVQYFVFNRYYQIDGDKYDVFNFSGEIKNVKILPSQKLFTYIKMFRGDDHIIGEKVKELSGVNQKFMLSLNLSEYDGYETIQFGFIIEGPRFEDSDNLSTFEIGPWNKENFINSNQAINTTVSPNLNGAWVLGYSSLKNFQKGILKFSRWANRDELNFSLDRGNKLIKLSAKF